MNDECLPFTATASPIMQSNDAIQSQSGGKKPVLVLYCHVLGGSGVKHAGQAKTGPGIQSMEHGGTTSATNESKLTCVPRMNLDKCQ
jgi:hypothetical protein